MDLLSELNMSTDWGLGLGDQPNGLFGDLEDFCHPKGDTDPAFKPRDAVQQMVLSPESPQDPLDLEWMESGDLVSFLDSLDNSQVGLSTSQDNLLDCSPSLEVKNGAISLIQTGSYLYDTGMEVNLFNQGLALTPPDSPEQVTPVITLPFESNSILYPSPSCDKVTVALPNTSITIPSNLPFVDFQTDFLVDTTDSLFDIQLVQPEFDTKEDVDFLYTSDDQVFVSSDDQLLYSSASSSRSTTPKPNIDSMIESCPELYKVIATPVSSRYSPYSKVKAEQKVKFASKLKSSKNCILDETDLVSEEIIVGHLGKRERKKLQNKNAAIRYRQKKKAEVEVISSEVHDLEKKNGVLKGKVDDIQREIRYMKNLMEDIYKAKGLLVKK